MVNKLVEIVEADLGVDDDEAQVLSDAMDAEVRSQLYQHCKLNAPFPKGWKADCACTGGKGPNNQWGHAEYIENPVNK